MRTCRTQPTETDSMCREASLPVQAAATAAGRHAGVIPTLGCLGTRRARRQGRAASARLLAAATNKSQNACRQPPPPVVVVGGTSACMAAARRGAALPGRPAVLPTVRERRQRRRRGLAGLLPLAAATRWAARSSALLLPTDAGTTCTCLSPETIAIRVSVWLLSPPCVFLGAMAAAAGAVAAMQVPPGPAGKRNGQPVAHRPRRRGRHSRRQQLRAHSPSRPSRHWSIATDHTATAASAQPCRAASHSAASCSPLPG